MMKNGPNKCLFMSSVIIHPIMHKICGTIQMELVQVHNDIERIVLGKPGKLESFIGIKQRGRVEGS